VTVGGGFEVKILNSYGISEERFFALSRELAIKEATLLNFIKSVNPDKADPSNIETTLRDLTAEYHEQRERLRSFSTDDPAVDELKRKAREALERGELPETERLLNAASKLDLDAVAKVEEIRLARRRSAAALKLSIARLKYARLQHAEAAVYYCEAADLLPPEDEATVARYLLYSARAQREDGDFQGALETAGRVLEIRQTLAGPNHPDVAECLNEIGAMLDGLGRYREAVPNYQRALSIRENTAGVSEKDIAQSLNNLGTVYDHLNRVDEAEALYRRALEMRLRLANGENDLDVALTYSNLAVLCYKRRHYADAESFYTRAIAIRERLLSPENLAVATLLNSLAVVYQAQDKLGPAEELLHRVLAIRQAILPPTHPSLAVTFNSLGVLLSQTGSLLEAEALLKRALAIRTARFGNVHPDTARTQHNLAALYVRQDRYNEAELLQRDAIAANQKLLPPNHDELASNFATMGEICAALGKRAEARAYYEHALAIFSTSRNPADPMILEIRRSISRLGGNPRRAK
jgi:tetratricopeptide (TPR) repeat protein